MRTTPFDSLEDYIALPRTESLALSPDGRWAVLGIATLNKDGTGYDRALWQVPADGSDGAPRRLTRSAKGESSAAYTADGDLLFLSARPDGGGTDDEPAQLWLLPAAGGEARPVTRLAGGVSAIEAVAAASDVVIVSAPLLPSAETIEDDARLRAERTKHKVTAILHETYPVRYWDHDLGPDEPHLFALSLGELAEQVGVEGADPAGGERGAGERNGGAAGGRAGGEREGGGGAVGGEAGGERGEKDAASTPYPPSLPHPRDLTPHPGRSADTAGVAITPDGTTVVAAMTRHEGRDTRTRLVAIDVATRTHTVLRDEPGVDNESPAVSHDGSRLAWVRTAKSTAAGPADQELWTSAIDGSVAHRLGAGWDRWPTGLEFAADDDALIVSADQDGRGPLFRVPLGGGAGDAPGGGVRQLVDDDFTYLSATVDRIGGDIVALRTNWMMPPHAVRIHDGRVRALPSPVPLPAVPASMTEVETTAADGARVRGWLMLPEGASAHRPAPLLLWIHGGPLNSWNGWSWRWNPQLLVARGYAVLLPDPALSTGYGLEFIARGWNDWGGKPYTDLMSITDDVTARADIDETRTAAMGGSFGGYMANWVAGHTTRFRAIVTHASLWALDQFAGTTDHSPYWQQIFTPAAMIENSPHRHIRDIRTPMLVVHGDRDYRVPIGEGLRLWSELNEHFAAEDGTSPHRFLYFPDENHWVLRPQHAVVWYQTVFAFLGEHVLGQDWVRPDRVG